ncbi:MAG: efflux RND transporter permease subunit [Planctomycetota bacterium]
MLARFFVDRPIFATVLSLVIVIVGLVALLGLPIAQYPEVVPPTISVTATYPGANAETVASTVAFPIEQEVNGVERMLYMASRCTNDGQMVLDVTFELGTNLDIAQVLVQNRVAVAQAKLPEDVKRIGVTTKKKSPSILLCVNLISPDGRYDQLYLSNFATTTVRDALARLKGVGDVAFLGPRDYSMRVWLDPERVASHDLTSDDVIRAIRVQNVQVAAGRLGQPPVPADQVVPFQLTINTQGRLVDPEQFGDIIVKTGSEGQLVYLRDLVSEVRRDTQGQVVQQGIELGAKNYDVNSYLDGQPAVTLALFQLPGSNALATAEGIRARMEELKASFPEGVDYRIVYDTTVFIDESVHEVYKTLFEAFVLVFIVVLLFLQDWRATVLPMIDVPVSLIGTLAVMSAMGFSLNNLTLFGLVLAIGIVVDDAIVVVENIERWMAKGLPPREATIKAMGEITGPVIAITLVLSSVFIPTAFLAGITGQFYRQFALTVATATIISAINAMTMAPARAVALIRPHSKEHAPEALPPPGIALLVGFLIYHFGGEHVLGIFGMGPAAHEPSETVRQASGTALWAVRLGVLAAGTAAGWFIRTPINRGLTAFLKGFNWVFDKLSAGYGGAVRGIVRVSVIALLVYAGLLGLTYAGLSIIPKGFIPEQDKGYLLVNAQLPDGASLGRTNALVLRLGNEARSTPGVAHTLEVPGYSALLGTNLSNAGTLFVILDEFEKRKHDPELSARKLGARLREKFAEHQEAVVGVFGAPPVEGIGSTSGIKIQVQNRRGAGLRALQGGVSNLGEVAQQDPRVVGTFSTFSVAQPQLRLDIDREKARSQGVSLDDLHNTLQTYLGSHYVNDFTFQNRNWQVNVQADPAFRTRVEDIGKLEVRNAAGARVPLGTLVNVSHTSGPPLVNHYNLYPSAELTTIPAPGVSSAQTIALMDRLSVEQLPTAMGHEWTELSLQEVLAAEDLLARFIFPLAVLFVFLVLAAQYESWSLPFAILLIVPMCIFAALIGIWMTKLAINIFVQIGLIVLIGLAAKNAILVVEFSKQLQDHGKSRIDAVVEACRVRLRPILMTSFAFVLGVLPLVLANGAGAEMRFSLGVAVFSGMIGVTLFGLIFTPVFYNVIRGLIDRRAARKARATSAAESAAEVPA